jgi:hypothetical protein
MNSVFQKYISRIDRKIIVLSVIFSLNSLLLIVYSGLKGTFFTIDPDAMYAANVISLIRYGRMYFWFHPGVLAIILMAVFVFPVRVLFKLVGINFYTFIYQYYDHLFVFLRISQLFLFMVGLYLFFKAIKKVTNSYKHSLFAGILIMLFTPIYYLGVSISAETTTFLVVALWLYIFSLFLEKTTKEKLFLLFFISGLSLGNRLTNLFLIIATFAILSIFLVGQKNKLGLILKSIKELLFGFVISIIVVLDKIRDLINGTLGLALTTQVHGGGEKKLFDLQTYILSVKSLKGSERFAFVVVIVSIIISLFIVTKIKSKNKVYRYVYVVYFTTLVGILAFSKYPLSHYQISNYMIIVFVLMILISNFSRKVTSILMLIAVYYMVFFGMHISKINIISINKTRAFENFVEKSQSSYPIMWEWGRNKEFGILWGNDWAGGVYVQETLEKSDKYSLTSTMTKIRNNTGDDLSLNEICWENLYIQGVSVDKFIKLNNQMSFSKFQIPGSDDMFLIKSFHCKSS